MTEPVKEKGPATQPRRTLPRRANTIRAVAAQLADRRLREVTLRQAVSDRIGYLVASMLGAGAMRYFGMRGVQALACLYVLAALFAYWRAADAKKPPA